MPTSLTQVNALSSLLTTESLLFAVLSVTIGLGSTSTAKTIDPKLARTIALGVTVTLTTVAVGGLVSWSDLVLSAWPSDVARSLPMVAMALGIVAQPVFAWMIVYHLYRDPSRRRVFGR